MNIPGNRVAWLFLAVCAFWIVLPVEKQAARAQEGMAGAGAFAPDTEGPGRGEEGPLGVPLQELLPQHRDSARLVLAQPTLMAHGPLETFACRPGVYFWLLDHPDQAVPIWRRLGAKCMDIVDQGGGRYGWADRHGSEVHWQTVYRGPRQRIWYAEGSVRPAPLLPVVPARAVVVLRYIEGHDHMGRTFVRHQADIFVQTDSKTAALATRLLGPSAPRLARQCMGQMEMFFSALSWYFEHYPERADALVVRALPADSPQALELRRLIATPPGTSSHSRVSTCPHDIKS
jgi:hypothetical protein